MSIWHIEKIIVRYENDKRAISKMYEIVVKWHKDNKNGIKYIKDLKILQQKKKKSKKQHETILKLISNQKNVRMRFTYDAEKKERRIS